MGVLDPLDRNAEELEELNDEYSEWIDWTIENLNNYAGAILNDRHDLMEDEDPFFFLLWRENSDAMTIDSMEELNEDIERLKMYKESVSLGAIEARYVKAFTDKADVESDYDNPIKSYAELEEAEQKLEGLDKRLEEKITEKFDLDDDHFKQEYDKFEYRLLETLYSLADSFDAMPVKEAMSEAKDNIEREKENLLSKAVDEHRKHKESVNEEYDRVDIPLTPVDWAEVIEEENIQDYMDISEIPSVTYGDTLHMMMEELTEDLDSVEPEYPLHFRNKGGRNDVNKENRIDNTLRPDAVDDLFVYEFKHMPKEQSQYLDENGDVEMNGKHRENIDQLNTYLNELDLPAGMLVYVSSDMEVKEYVVEQHDKQASRSGNYLEEFIHEKDEYDFENVASRL